MQITAVRILTAIFSWVFASMQKLSIDQALFRAKILIKNGELFQARDLYLSIIATFPHNSRAKQALAILEADLTEKPALQSLKDVIDQLTSLYKSADFQRVITQTDDISDEYRSSFDIWNLRAVSFAALKKFAEAEKCFQSALQLSPRRPDTYFNLGVAMKELGRLEESITMYRRAIELKPDYADAHNNLGMILKDLGNIDDAARCLGEALACKPNSVEILYNLSLLKRFDRGDEMVEKMNKLYHSGKLTADEKSFVCFSLYKANEDIGNIDEAYRFLSEGNEIIRQTLGYQFVRDQTFFDRLKSVSAKIAPPEKPFPRSQVLPIFILGMPRSGTTLVEQIVSSHSNVHGAGELEDLNRLINPILKQGTLFDQPTLTRIRLEYIAKLARIAGTRQYVTDKMPHNFRWIPIIAAAFPEAKIIHVKRDARAVCWSNYKHYFKQKGLGYTYNLDDTIAYYKLYEQLMSSFDTLCPQRVYHLDYEKLTADPDVEIRALVDHLELGWEESCLEYEKNTRSVKTASTVQVRKKIYQGSSQEWRKYEHFLEKSFVNLQDVQM